jgi:hypothetical protein
MPIAVAISPRFPDRTRGRLILHRKKPVQGFSLSAPICAVESWNESSTTPIRRRHLPSMTGMGGTALGGSPIPLSGHTAKSQ